MDQSKPAGAWTRFAVVGTIAGVSLMNAGCWELILPILVADDPEPAATGEPPDYYDDDYGGPVDFRTTALSGTLGRQEFEGGIWREEGYDYGGVASLSTHARSVPEDWAAMTAITIEGGVAHPDLVPGAVLEFDRERYAYDPGAGPRLHIAVLGCSGRADGVWDYDVPADEVTVEVQEGADPGEIVLDYEARWDDGSQVNGSIAVRPR